MIDGLEGPGGDEKEPGVGGALDARGRWREPGWEWGGNCCGECVWGFIEKRKKKNKLGTDVSRSE